MPRQKPKTNKEKPKLVNLNTRVPEDLVIEVKVFCVRNKISIQDFVTDALKAKLKGKKQ